jgi:hypothetical protein
MSKAQSWFNATEIAPGYSARPAKMEWAMSEPGNREPTDIVGYDDAGAAITDNDLLLESYREPLPGIPLSLLPPYEWEGTDDEWEEKQLIDAVKERRRRAATAKAGAAGAKR